VKEHVGEMTINHPPLNPLPSKGGEKKFPRPLRERAGERGYVEAYGKTSIADLRNLNSSEKGSEHENT